MRSPVRRTAGKFRNFGDERGVFLAPIDDDLVLVHSVFPSLYFSTTARTLLYLVRLGVVAVSLHIDSLFHASFPKDVMAALGAFCKPDALQQGTQIVKADRCIGRTAEYLLERFLLTHIAILRWNTEDRFEGSASLDDC